MDHVHRRLLKPLTSSWAVPAGSYWMLALDVFCRICSLLRAGFGVIPAGFRTSPVAEGSSLSFPQAGTPRCPWARPLVTAVGKACGPLLGLWH